MKEKENVKVSKQASKQAGIQASRDTFEKLFLQAIGSFSYIRCGGTVKREGSKQAGRHPEINFKKNVSRSDLGVSTFWWYNSTVQR